MAAIREYCRDMIDVLNKIFTLVLEIIVWL